MRKTILQASAFLFAALSAGSLACSGDSSSGGGGGCGGGGNEPPPLNCPKGTYQQGQECARVKKEPLQKAERTTSGRPGTGTTTPATGTTHP